MVSCGKAEKMRDDRPALRDRPRQLRGHFLLMPARNRQDHPPVAAQDIRLPHSAAIGLQRRRLLPAEVPQRIVARHDDAFRFGAGHPRDCAALPPEPVRDSVFLPPPAARRQTARGKKTAAPNAPSQNNGGCRSAASGGAGKSAFAAAGSRTVFPDQFIGVGKRVPVKLEAARRRCGRGNHAWTSIGFQLTKGNAV